MNKALVLLLLTAFLGCSSKGSKLIAKSKSLSEKDPEKALLLLDQGLSDAVKVNEKLKFILAIEEIVKKKVKKASYYKRILEKKLIYLKNDQDKNEALLSLSKLLIQNFKDNVGALNYLEQIKVEELNKDQRELYFKSVLIANINNKKYSQALIEVNSFLQRKDLTPSERFKIQVLKARTYTDYKKVDSAEAEYKQLLNQYPNLSKKWKLRTQLALTLEGQKKYKEAIEQLKAYALENKDEDSLLEWRIQELEKRLAQQPGGKGRLKR